MIMKKYLLLIITIIYCGFLLCFLSAEIFYRDAGGRASQPEALSAINKAVCLNPFNAQYYNQQYLIEKNQTTEPPLSAIRQAIELDPLKASYHMYYGLALLKDLPSDNYLAQNRIAQAKKELSRAKRLKPYSELYAQIYNAYFPSK